MNSQDNLLARVEKLERQNRRMKLIGFGSLIVAGAVLLMGQARQPTVLSEVRAKSFVLVDARGRDRGALRMVDGEPELDLFDEKQTLEAVLFASSTLGPGLTLHGPKGIEYAELSVDTLLSGPGLSMGSTNGKSVISLRMASGEPQLNLTDEGQYETAIGVTDLITPTTGEKHTTSAASIVLFGKDKKVLWSAPRQDGN